MCSVLQLQDNCFQLVLTKVQLLLRARLWRYVVCEDENNHCLCLESNPSRPSRGPVTMLAGLSGSEPTLYLYNVGVSVPWITASYLMEYLIYINKILLSQRARTKIPLSGKFSIQATSHQPRNIRGVFRIIITLNLAGPFRNYYETQI